MPASCHSRTICPVRSVAALLQWNIGIYYASLHSSHRSNVRVVPPRLRSDPPGAFPRPRVGPGARRGARERCCDHRLRPQPAHPVRDQDVGPAGQSGPAPAHGCPGPAPDDRRAAADPECQAAGHAHIRCRGAAASERDRAGRRHEPRPVQALPAGHRRPLRDRRPAVRSPARLGKSRAPQGASPGRGFRSRDRRCLGAAAGPTSARPNPGWPRSSCRSTGRKARTRPSAAPIASSIS